MKPMTLKIMIGTAIVLFFVTTSVWAGGRGRGHHQGGGHGYHRGHKIHQDHRYKGHGRHYRNSHRHHGPRHHYRGPRHHKRHGHRHYYNHPRHGYGLYFSLSDPYFSFGFSTGGYR